jgi:S-adenosylmethionine:tRNA ribosyltransferase-isomerase
MSLNLSTRYRLSDFDFDLPEELIAQHPAERRSGSRLLQVVGGALSDRFIAELPSLLQPGDLMVFNDTQVIKARLFGRRDSGGAAEIMIDRVMDERHARAMLRVSHQPRPGSKLILADDTELTVIERQSEFYLLQSDEPFLTLIDRLGQLPLPPYITHQPDGDDAKRYQTVYATSPGAVAAPTAGLHFDTALLNALDRGGICRATLTLHVGAGTFLPVRQDDLSLHQMHDEQFEIPASLPAAIERTKRAGHRVVAVGTTSLRALESAADDSGKLRSGQASTQLFITPGYRFKVVDVLLTNFHLPKSTLLMLVSAFAGMDTVRRAYAHAIADRYRFFSYGDAMLMERS